MEIAVRYRSDAWRAVYATGMGGTLRVIHAFRKKSTTGIKAPKAEGQFDTLKVPDSREGRSLRQRWARNQSTGGRAVTHRYGR